MALSAPRSGAESHGTGRPATHRSPPKGRFSLLDADRFGATVDRVERLQPSTIAGAHSPVIDGDEVVTALRMGRRALDLPPADAPGQADLEGMLARIHGGDTPGI